MYSEKEKFRSMKEIFKGKGCTYSLVTLSESPSTIEDLVRLGSDGVEFEIVSCVAVQYYDQSAWLVYPNKLGTFIIEDLLQEAEEDGTGQLYGAELKEALLEFRR